MALLEGHGQKDLKIDESIPYAATITNAISVEDHVVNVCVELSHKSVNFMTQLIFLYTMNNNVFVFRSTLSLLSIKAFNGMCKRDIMNSGHFFKVCTQILVWTLNFQRRKSLETKTEISLL